MTKEEDTPGVAAEVQWCAGYASGVRSWAAHGITLVHRTDDMRETLCGRSLPRERYRWSGVSVDGARCKACSAKLAARAAAV